MATFRHYGEQREGGSVQHEREAGGAELGCLNRKQHGVRIWKGRREDETAMKRIGLG